MNPIARMLPWKVRVAGKVKTISVLSTGVPDLGSLFGRYDGNYDNAKAYQAGAVVRVLSSAVVGGVTLTPGVYGCAADVDALGVGNMVPQWPEPATGTVCWFLIAFPPRLVNVCANGSKQIYANSSASF